MGKNHASQYANFGSLRPILQIEFHLFLENRHIALLIINRNIVDLMFHNVLLGVS